MRLRQESVRAAEAALADRAAAAENACRDAEYRRRAAEAAAVAAEESAHKAQGEVTYDNWFAHSLIFQTPHTVVCV